MRKTVFVVTEERARLPEREARDLVQRSVTLWLKGVLGREREKGPGDPAGNGV